MHHELAAGLCRIRLVSLSVILCICILMVRERERSIAAASQPERVDILTHHHRPCAWKALNFGTSNAPRTELSPGLGAAVGIASRTRGCSAVSQAAANATVSSSSSSFSSQWINTQDARCSARQGPQSPGCMGAWACQVWHRRLRPSTVNGPAPHRVQPPPAADSGRIGKWTRPRTPCCGVEHFAVRVRATNVPPSGCHTAGIRRCQSFPSTRWSGLFFNTPPPLRNGQRHNFRI